MVLTNRRRRNSSKSKTALTTYNFATETELESFLLESKDNQESRTVGYIFEINEDQEFTVGRVEQARIVELMRFDMNKLFEDETVTAMTIDKNANKLFFAFSNGIICELKAQTMNVNDVNGRYESQYIELCPLKIKENNK